MAAFGLMYWEMESLVDFVHIEYFEYEELLIFNFGLYYFVMYGVLWLIMMFEGEVVRDVKLIIGYVHIGIEKNCEDKFYWKVILFVEWMDYFFYYFNVMVYCGAVEMLIGFDVLLRV